MQAILDAAERRLREGGYGALSVAGLARGLGLAQNAVYWYFPSKDHLFVAALERMLGDVLEGPLPGGSAGEQLLAAVDRLAALQPLRASVIERSRASPVVAAFEARLRAALRERLVDALRKSVPESELAMATEVVVAQVEGAFLHNTPPAERRRLLAYVLQRLTRT